MDYDRIAEATVHLIKNDGQGVLVSGGVILTAAHCVDFTATGEMVLGGHFPQEIGTVLGQIWAEPIAVEPRTDIAALIGVDVQDGYPIEMASGWEKFESEVKPVHLSPMEVDPFEEFRVHIYTHLHTWVTGHAQQTRKGAPTLAINFDEPIAGGTSGGPVVTDTGELVAVVSNVGGAVDSPKQDGTAPRPLLALPVWVVRQHLSFED